jgi:hypothetical protein
MLDLLRFAGDHLIVFTVFTLVIFLLGRVRS